MITIATAHFGPIPVEELSALDFPGGLPGFEDERRFVAIQHPANAALVFLQSASSQKVCFVAVPVRTWRPDYDLDVAAEDLALLGLPAGRAPEIGKDVIALTILSLAEGEPPTANLLAPVVVALETRRAVQAIRTDGRYACREPLPGGECACS